MNRDSGSAEFGQVNLILLTEEGAELPEDTRLRLLTLVENDRLGSGLAISLRELESRGGGDLAGEDQAGHIKPLGSACTRSCSRAPFRSRVGKLRVRLRAQPLPSGSQAPYRRITFQTPP